MATKGKGKNTVSIVEELLEDIVVKNNVVLWDVIFEKEGASWFLRVYIDKENGVSFDDCENVSRSLDKLLDELDPIEQSYYLEVSSPGLDRLLTKDWHFNKYLNNKVFLKTIRPIDNKREFVGDLIKKEDNIITILDNEIKEEMVFIKQDLVLVRLCEEINF
ncbi:MAG: ribosome maturation factor RimP [Oscillospiraceae bacterium]